MKKILFIEDELSLIEAYKNKFQAGYEINFSFDGESGLKKAKEWRPDLIVLDILIPGEINGVGVLKELKANKDTILVPVLVLTNLEDQEEITMALGAVECLVKSNTSFETVAKKISDILD